MRGVTSSAPFIKDDHEGRSPILSAAMHRLSISSTSSEERRARRKRIWCGLGAALMFLVLLTAALAIWLPRRHDDDSDKNRPSCAHVTDDLQRFDCHPDRPISQKACLERGCCYIPASDLRVKDSDLIDSRFLGVPSCFFPVNYTGYEVTENKADGNSVRAELKRVRSSGFPGDEKKVVLEITPIDDNRLRIKIKDASSTHYVPDVPVLDLEVQKERKESYTVEFTEQNGLLTVKRNSSGQAVFRAELARLIFSDQFLQLSTEIASEHIYGLGEQKETIHKSTNWARYTLFNQGDLPVPNRNLYGSHPFYMVMEPDGMASGVFLLNTNAMDYVVQATPAVTFRTVGGIFDFYLFLGPTPADVVKQYTALFGNPNFPPRWSLGFQLCKYGYFTLNKTKDILERNLKAGVPIDVQWHDIDYMKRYLDFTYDPVNFKGLPQFVEELHAQNRHYIAMISPGVSNTEEPGTYAAYDEGKDLDLFIKDTDGNYIEGKVWNTNMTVFPDFSNDVSTDYWKKRFKEFKKILDFDGVWIDMNEPLNFLNGSNKGCPDTKYDNPKYLPGRPYPLKTLTLCMSAKHKNTQHYNEHNLVAYREARATYLAMKEITNKRPFIISRASFSGQGVYSGHWSGDIRSDWAALRYSIPAMLAFSLYGMPMTGSDICGFVKNTTEELCTRWQSVGAFYPFSRNHNDYDTIEQDPAAMGPNVLASTKKALAIRYYLLPYLYTLFYRNHVYGETVARPLFFEFPTDKATYTIEDEFLWGPAFLIMPALEQGVTSIKPYIPKGIWYDYKTGNSRTSNGDRVELEAGLTDINLMMRGGYVLPAQTPGNTTTDSAKSPFDFLVALNEDNKAEGELFWDDGESLDTYKEEHYNLIKIEASKNGIQFTPTVKANEIPMHLGLIRVYGVHGAPSKVMINKTPVDFLLKEHELNINGTTFSLLDKLTVEW